MVLEETPVEEYSVVASIAQIIVTCIPTSEGRAFTWRVTKKSDVDVNRT